MSKKLSYLLIILIGLSLYAITVFFDFSYFDDQDLILNNYSTISNLKNIDQIFLDDVFMSDSNFYFRPILNLSFMLDAQISLVHPWFYHLSNVFIHIIAVLLLFSLLLILGTKHLYAWFLSLFFLVHPVLVSAVAWIPGRNDSLLAVFILASFLFFIKFINQEKWLYYGLFLLFFFFALFTKEAGIFLPFIIFFYYLFISPKKLDKERNILLIFGSSLVIFLWALFRGFVIDGSIGSLSEIFLTILNFSPALIVSFGKFLLPFNLGVMPLLHEANLIFGILSIILFALLLVFKKVKKEWFLFGIIWFLFFSLPGLLNPDPKISYQILLLEHRLYLPFIGLVLLLAGVKFKKNNKMYLLTGFAFIIVTLFIILTALRLPYYKNRLSFWQYATNTSPSSPLAHRNLGVMLYFAGNIKEAEASYLKSLDLNPSEPMAHNNLGVIYMERGDLDKAKEEFLLELEINPGYKQAIDNLYTLQDLLKQLR